MSRKNKNPNRQGFLNYCRTIAGIEKDKDEFCKAARIPRGGADIFGNLDGVFRDLNRMRRSTFLCSEYQQTISQIRAMISEQNAHELRMAEIEAGKRKEDGESTSDTE